MERMTIHDFTGAPMLAPGYESRFSTVGTIGKLIERLAAYEDTGMTPEEITEAEGRRHNCKIECLLREYNKFAKLFSTDGSGAVTDADIDRARELLKADREGRVLVLPVKIGAKVMERGRHVFTVEKVQTCTVYDKPALIFRCGNPGTGDYMAFYDFEIGKDIEIIQEEAAGGGCCGDSCPVDP